MEFSVLMSVYIKEKTEFLERALESIYNQTLKPKEVILVKDGLLTEELETIISKEIRKFNESNIDFTCIQLEKNMGLGTALQTGLEKCYCDYIKKNPQISVVGGYINEFIEEGKIIRTKTMPLKYKELYKYGKYRNPLNHMTVLFRKKDVIDSGGYQPMKGLEDYYLWSRMLAKGYKISNIDKVLVNARLGDFSNRRGGIGYFLTYVKLRKTQNKLHYTNILEFIIGVMFTAVITLAPNSIRGGLYKVLRKSG